MSSQPEVVLVRHGETEWTITRRHTGRTDVPLTENGRQQAKLIGARLGAERFTRVLTSPLARAADTCRLAGYGDVAESVDDLMEWDYGDYDGLRSADIREERPGWLLWHDGVPGGETAAEVAARVDRVIASIRSGSDVGAGGGSDSDAVAGSGSGAGVGGGPVAVFAHGHLLRAFASRWLGMAPDFGAHLVLGPASICRLGWDHGVPAITLWNDRSHLA